MMVVMSWGLLQIIDGLPNQVNYHWLTSDKRSDKTWQENRNLKAQENSLRKLPEERGSHVQVYSDFRIYQATLYK